MGLIARRRTAPAWMAPHSDVPEAQPDVAGRSQPYPRRCPVFTRASRPAALPRTSTPGRPRRGSSVGSFRISTTGPAGSVGCRRGEGCTVSLVTLNGL